MNCLTRQQSSIGPGRRWTQAKPVEFYQVCAVPFLLFSPIFAITIAGIDPILPISIRGAYALVFLSIIMLMGYVRVGNAVCLYASIIFFEPVANEMQLFNPWHLHLVLFIGSVILFMRCRERRFRMVSALLLVVALSYSGNFLGRPGVENSTQLVFAIDAFAAALLMAVASSDLYKQVPLGILCLVGAISLTLTTGFTYLHGSLKSGLSINELAAFRLSLSGANTTGYLCATGVLMWLSSYAFQSANKWYPLVGGLICFVGLILSGSLGSVIPALLFVAVALVVKMRQKIFLTSSIALLSMALGIWAGFVVFKDWFILGGNRDIATMSGRLFQYADMVEIVRSNPLGVSWVAYTEIVPTLITVIKDGVPQLVPLTPHNQILQSFVFGGWAGGVAFTILHILLVTQMLWRFKKMDGKCRVYMLIPLLVISVHCTIDIWYFSYYFILTWLAINTIEGQLVVSSRVNIDRKHENRSIFKYT